MNTLYRTRTFSEKFSLVFEWMRCEWKTVLKFVTLFLLPVSLLQGFGFSSMVNLSLANAFSGGYSPASMGATNIAGMGLYYLCAIVGSLLVYSLTLFFVRRNMMDGQSNVGLTAGEALRGAMHFVPKLILMGLVMMVILVVAVGILIELTLTSPWTLIVTLPIFLSFGVALMPCLPNYTLTDAPLFSSIGHGLRLGYKCWWGFFSTSFVMGLLAMVIAGFASIPLYIVIGIKAAFGSSFDAGSTGLMDFLSYLGGVLSTYASFMLSILTVAILCVQYGHAADKCDGITAQKEVDEFPEF